MDWASDFGGGSDYFDMPSFDTQAEFPTFGNDLMSQFDVPYVDTFDPYMGATWINDYLSPEVTGSVNTTQTFPTSPGGYSQGSLGAPGASIVAPQQPDWGSLLSPAGLLGIGGGLAGLIGTIAGGGVTGRSGVQPTTAQKAAMQQGQSMLSPFATGTSPLQQQQQSLLAAIMSGQGLAQPYAQAVERAYQPQLGDLYSQAVEQGRRSGFYDSPATAPPGGAILGPGLAQLQGQIARDKLNLMTQLPGLYNTPISNQGSFAQQFLSAAQDPRLMPSQQSAPLGPQIGAQIGSGLQSIGQAYGQQQTQAQQMNFQNSLLDALRGMQPTSMSGATY